MGEDQIMQLLLEYRYAIMAPAVMLLGPIVSLVAGVLLRLEAIHIVPTVLALAIGELGSDVLWYWVGRRYGEPFLEKFGRFFGVTKKKVARAEALFRRHQDVIIFTSKITAGLGFAMAILFVAGHTRVPFWRYMMLNVVGQFLWTAALLSIGYFLGHAYLYVGSVFEKMALFALLALVVAALVGFARYLHMRAATSTL